MATATGPLVAIACCSHSSVPVGDLTKPSMGAYPIDALFPLLNLHLPSHVPLVPDEY